MTQRLVVSTEEAAVLLGMSHDTLKARTDVPYFTVGQNRRYSVRDLEAWVAAQPRKGVQAADEPRGLYDVRPIAKRGRRSA